MKEMIKSKAMVGFVVVMIGVMYVNSLQMKEYINTNQETTGLIMNEVK